MRGIICETAPHRLPSNHHPLLCPPPPTRTADEAIDRFLSHLVPPSMNVYFSSQAHAPGSTPLKEEWYGAQYGVQPLSQVS